MSFSGSHILSSFSVFLSNFLHLFPTKAKKATDAQRLPALSKTRKERLMCVRMCL
jgi:hypothetical protein